jgi:hypothetical protein
LTAFAIASTLVCATWTDHTRVRWPVLVYMSVSCIIASICILVWSSPIGLKFFAYCEFVALIDAGLTCTRTNTTLQICLELHMPVRRQHLRECMLRSLFKFKLEAQVLLYTQLGKPNLRRRRSRTRSRARLNEVSSTSTSTYASPQPGCLFSLLMNSNPKPACGTTFSTHSGLSCSTQPPTHRGSRVV